MIPFKSERICIFGIVQGVGFRPFVSRIAMTNDIKGSVCNKGSYVEIEAYGSTDQIDRFVEEIKTKTPERASILNITRQNLSITGANKTKYPNTFSIIESSTEEGDIFVSPDIGICEECKKELFDPSNKRYLHPFINCTACGPRLTILEAMPYDRERTSMGVFPMCEHCAEEYHNPASRRYDAQPVCCPECGPKVYVLFDNTFDTANQKSVQKSILPKGHAAISYVRQAIMNGKIISIKGIGGFHLCCDAHNDDAVTRLRKLKHRPIKPFAVMLRDITAVETYCVPTKAEKDLLEGHEKPIVLIKKKSSSSNLSSSDKLLGNANISKSLSKLSLSIAPDNPSIGVMLPYAPLQLLLFNYDNAIAMTDALIMTSANDSGAPICHTDELAMEELTDLCDIILSHNRQIRVRTDDSVMMVHKEQPYMVRRSRGYAPLPVMTNFQNKSSVLAIGGELKNAFCLAKNNLYYMSPHVGDMGDIRTVKALGASIKRMEELLEVTPTAIVCDRHPGYQTRKYAEALANARHLPLIEVQHHYAHILSCMVENNVNEPVIGIALDGTGYGTDGTIWGGEILVADYESFQRVSHITPFKQAGGDISAKEGWRVAVSLLYDLYQADRKQLKRIVNTLELCDKTALTGQLFLLDNNINTVTSTSVGRLFDAVSAILGIKKASTFEGEAAMALEFSAEEWLHTAIKNQNSNAINTSINTNIDMELNLLSADISGNSILPTDVLIHKLTELKLSGEKATGELAYTFHKGLAQLLVNATLNIRRNTDINLVALSGGVFQNRLLLRLVEDGLKQHNFNILTHKLIPTNDGGIALGQAAYASFKIK